MRLWLQFGLMMVFPIGTWVPLVILWRRRKDQHMGRLTPLMLAILLNGIWASGLAAGFTGAGVHPALVSWWQKAADYALPLASGAILFATLAFLRVEHPHQKRWLYALLAGFALCAMLDPGILPLSLPALHIAGRIISHQGMWRIAWTLLWAGPGLAALRSIAQNYPREASPLHRNRVRYWALAVTVNLLGDILVMSWQPLMMQAGALIKLLGAVVATICTLAHRLPDMRVVLRRTISLLAVGIVTVVLFFLAMLGGQLIQRELQEPRAAFWAMGGLALLMVILFYLIRHVVQRAVDRLLFPDVFDLDMVLRDYGERISHLLPLEELAQTMISTVDEALHIDHGMLALLETKAEGVIAFRPVPVKGRPAGPVLSCAAESPVGRRLVEGGEPLAQFDVDVLPLFARLAESERETLSRWETDLYLPIRARGQTVGVLALGTKRSGDPYLDADIVLLRTLADQTAVALENARLFANLKALNQEIVALNRELEWVNLELLELDRLKSSFIGMVTHELRSPFVPIDLSLQLIQKHGLEHMLPEQREQVTQLTKSLAELRRMVDNLISFASLVSKQRSLVLDLVPLDEVVQEVVKPLEMMATARRVSIEVVVVEGLPMIRADRQRITDAVHHLVHNGIKFNRSGGSVQVRCDHGEGRVMVQVADTGRGIPEERLESLGDPFVQLADPVKRGIEGVGLGLALAKYIVQAHGGELTVESKLGVGSTFSLHLPVDGPGARRGDALPSLD